MKGLHLNPRLAPRLTPCLAPQRHLQQQKWTKAEAALRQEFQLRLQQQSWLHHRLNQATMRLALPTRRYYCRCSQTAVSACPRTPQHHHKRALLMIRCCSCSLEADARIMPPRAAPQVSSWLLHLRCKFGTRTKKMAAGW